MSLFSFVKEAGEKLLGLDDEEPEGTEVPEIKPAGANTSAAMLHLMLTKHNLAPEARAHARAHRTCRPPVACPRVGRRRPVRATERDIFSRRRIQDANSQVGELASGHRLDHQGASGISAGVATALSSAALSPSTLSTSKYCAPPHRGPHRRSPTRRSPGSPSPGQDSRAARRRPRLRRA